MDLKHTSQADLQAQSIKGEILSRDHSGSPTKGSSGHIKGGIIGSVSARSGVDCREFAPKTCEQVASKINLAAFD